MGLDKGLLSALSDHKQRVGQPHFILSAENPRHPNENKLNLSHEQTLAHLQGAGYNAHGVSGHYGSPERSIIVYGTTPEQNKHLHGLASRLGQDSSIESTGARHQMHFHHGADKGKIVHGQGTNWHPTKPKDNFTTLPGGQHHFTHNFDFDKPELPKSTEALKPEATKPALNKTETFCKSETETAAAEPTVLEDLYAEHGLLARLAAVYKNYVKTHSNPDAVDKAAELIKTFYGRHHQIAEELFVFPKLKEQGKLVGIIDELIREHNAGNRLSQKILKASVDEKPAAVQKWLDLMAKHRVTEDSVVYPAFKAAVSPEDYRDAGRAAEAHEHQIYPEGVKGLSRRVLEIEVMTSLAGLVDIKKSEDGPLCKAAEPKAAEPKIERIGLEHYSNKPDLKTIEPKFKGTGVDARTKGRDTEHPHSFYYRAGTAPEDVVHAASSHKYATSIHPGEHKLYDIGGDPEGHVKAAVAENNNALNMDLVHAKLKRAGYSGFHNSRHPTLANVVGMYHPLNVENVVPAHQSIRKSENPEAYKDAAKEGIDLLFPVKINGKTHRPDINVRYHATIKIFDADKDDLERVHEMATNMKLNKPDPALVTIVPKIHHGMNGDNYILALEGHPADVLSDWHFKFNGFGRPDASDIGPHITVDKELWDKIQQQKPHHASDFNIEFDDAELRCGTKILATYHPVADQLFPDDSGFFGVKNA